MRKARTSYPDLAAQLLVAARWWVPQLLPDGVMHGDEWVAINPTRVDRNKGSFRINLRSGKWKDFATGHGGSDLISLYAYINNIRQGEAATSIIKQLKL